MKSEWFISSDLSGSRFSSAPEEPGAECKDNEPNILTFLAAVQILKIELLRITWETARQDIGSGGTARVNEALITVQTSFAFKRVHNESKRNRTEAHIFQTLINEISVLGQPFVRDNPNVAQLQGICWDISPDDDRPWPVLVFEKTQFGDLQNFAQQPVGRRMGIDERIELCIDVATAISDMHSNTIVHGDIKPGNALIFQGEDGRYKAKVIDFGYSTRCVNDESLVRLPMTRPWNAPEHDRPARVWTLGAAKKTDVFSFGMLCLWLLFEPYFSGQKALPQGLHWKTFGLPCQSESTLDVLHKVKVEGKLTKLAHQLLETDPTLDHDRREVLMTFLESSLCEAAKRESKLDSFLIGLGARRQVELLRKASNPEQSPTASSPTSVRRESIFIPKATDFKIEMLLYDLYLCDYRLRSYVANYLIREQSRAESFAFGAALCHYIGFGVARDKVKSAEILSQSKYQASDLRETVLAWLGKSSTVRASILAELSDAGNIGWTTFSDTYLAQGKLVEAEAQLSRERDDILSTLGTPNRIAIQLELVIIMIYQLQGRWKEMMEKGERLVEWSQFQFPEGGVLLKADATSHISNSLFQQKRLKEAEAKQREVVEILRGISGAEHPSTLRSMADLASIYIAQARWQEAEEIHVTVLESRKKRFGEEHPVVLADMSALARLYVDQRLLNEAERTLLQVIETKTKVLGEENPLTLSSMSDLAGMYGAQGRWKEAEKKTVYVLDTRRKVLGEDHPSTLDSMSILAMMHDSQGHWKEAERVEQQAVMISETKRGKSDLSTLRTMIRLAERYIQYGRYQEAEEVGLLATQRAEAGVGVDHPISVDIKAILIETYKRQARWNEAKKTMEGLIKAREKALGTAHPQTLRDVRDLTWICANHEQFEQAEKLLIHTIKMAKKTNGNKHLVTWENIENLVELYVFQRRPKDAELILAQEADTIRDMLQEKNIDTLVSISRLADIYDHLQKWKEAEETDRVVLQMGKKVLGEGNQFIFATMDKIARALRHQGREEEANQIEVQTNEDRRRFLGENHPSALAAAARLARRYEDEGRLEESSAIMAQTVEEMVKLGEKHPDTFRNIEHLAWIRGTQKQWAEAERMQSQLVEYKKTTLNDEHPDLLANLSDLTSIYRTQGKWKEAEELELQILQKTRRALGEGHPLTLASLANLTSVYREQRRWKETEKMALCLWETCQRATFKEDPLMPASLKVLAQAYREQGRLLEAKETEHKLREWHREVMGPEVPNWVLEMGAKFYPWIRRLKMDGAVGFVRNLLDGNR